jgi:thiol-disulfide isomerase/thioredoxin
MLVMLAIGMFLSHLKPPPRLYLVGPDTNSDLKSMFIAVTGFELPPGSVRHINPDTPEGKRLLARLGVNYRGYAIAFVHDGTRASDVVSSVPDLEPLVARHFPVVKVLVKTLSQLQALIRSYRGKVVILDFWATNCEACRRELPGFSRLYRKYRELGLRIIAVSLDPDLDSTRVTARQEAMTYDVVWLPPAAQEELRKQYALSVIPKTFFFDRRGHQLDPPWVGFHDYRAFEQMVERLLAGKSPSLQTPGTHRPPERDPRLSFPPGSKVIIVGALDDERTKALIEVTHQLGVPKDILHVLDPSNPEHRRKMESLSVTPGTEPEATVCNDQSCALPTSDPQQLKETILEMFQPQ